MSPAHTEIPLDPRTAEPDWLENDTPFSREFGDVYFSRDDGCAESDYVFLRHSALAERWAALADSPETVFVIGETGFGTGLNFLLAWRLWERTAPPAARLVFRSIEAYPLGACALARALARWEELAPYAHALRAAWPPPLPGLHMLEFARGRVCLQLYLGEVQAALEECGAGAQSDPANGVDAWFLDGFAPARNPAMWSEAVMARVAALSRPGTTLATFTVAASVRGALAANGFRLLRVPGFGRKREMLTGVFEGRAGAASALPARETPWHLGAAPASREHGAVVIGAGIAGASCARALARRGWRVTVLEAAPAPGSAASGNPQGVLFTQLPATDTAHGDFTLHSYLHALRWYAELFGDDDPRFARCGLLQLHDENDAALARLRARYAGLGELASFVSADEASALAGVALARGGIHLPASGWLVPPEACRRALEHPLIRTRFDCRVTSLAADGPLWRVLAADGTQALATTVVVATASGTNDLLGADALPIAPLRGQITLLRAADLGATPRCVICAEGYVTPPRAGLLCCGASFIRGAGDDAPSAAEHRENLERLRELLPGIEPARFDTGALAGRVGYRASTPDRLPVAGPVPDAPAFRERFATLRHNARHVVARCGAWRAGLYVSAGHGSRGLTSAPLCAEAIAAAASGEPSPLPQRVQRALSPARFLIRDLIRGRTP